MHSNFTALTRDNMRELVQNKIKQYEALLFDAQIEYEMAVELGFGDVLEGKQKVISGLEDALSFLRRQLEDI